jgi:hypothetical protein
MFTVCMAYSYTDVAGGIPCHNRTYPILVFNAPMSQSTGTGALRVEFTTNADHRVESRAGRYGIGCPDQQTDLLM